MGATKSDNPTLKLESSIRVVRIVHAALLLAMFLYVLMAEKLPHDAPHDVHEIWIAFVVVGLMMIGMALFFRARWLQTAAETLQEKPDDQAALARWRSGNILSFVLAECIVLYGLGLRFMGGTTIQCLPFYMIGVAVMLLWWPRRP